MHGFLDPKFDKCVKTSPDIIRNQGCWGPAMAFKMYPPSLYSISPSKNEAIWVGGEEYFDKIMFWVVETTTFLRFAKLEKLLF